jgi:hypothetical protein
MSQLGFFFLDTSKEVTMTGTLGTSTPTDHELEAPNVLEVDALGVVLVDLLSEV